MATKIKYLREKSGDIVLPVTKAEAVIVDEEGRNIGDLIATIDQVDAAVTEMNEQVATLDEKVTDLRQEVNDDIKATLEDQERAIQDIWKVIYPVGAIYLSTANTSPATLFGGTWIQIKDRFLLAAGSTYTAGTTGGEATHKLTINEMPSHKHAMNNKADGGGNGNQTGYEVMQNEDAYHGDKNWWNFSSPGMWTESVGGSQSHNNMPPYLTVYIWKRTA